MRVVFVNLHVNGFFLNNLSAILARRKLITKQYFLLEWLMKNNIEIVDLVTLGGGCLFSNKISNMTRNLALRKLEARYIFRKNRISKKKVKIISDINLIDKDDIVIYYGTFFPSQFEGIERVKGKKIVDFMHFYGDKKSVEKIKDKGFVCYTYEVDLKKYSKLYQKNYSWFEGKYIMKPYAYQARFQNIKEFSKRNNKAMAIGTLTQYNNEEFAETYGTTDYQPRRRMILEHREELKEVLDSYVSEYNEGTLLTLNKADNIILRIYKKVINFYSAGKQKSYFSFDMVEKFNDYKMFICPEDINGSYGVGTIEGMACGCAMIGWNYGAFEDMGMVAGEHYISYDGTLEDLKKKIEYYQKTENQQKLEQIAKKGCDYVRANFSEEEVARKYFKQLSAL